jgi:hypothetical protein
MLQVDANKYQFMQISMLLQLCSLLSHKALFIPQNYSFASLDHYIGSSRHFGDLQLFFRIFSISQLFTTAFEFDGVSEQMSSFENFQLFKGFAGHSSI